MKGIGTGPSNDCELNCATMHATGFFCDYHIQVVHIDRVCGRVNFEGLGVRKN